MFFPCLSMKIPEKNLETSWSEKEAECPSNLLLQPGLRHQLSFWVEELLPVPRLLFSCACHFSYFIWLTDHLWVFVTIQYVLGTVFDPKYKIMN